MRIAALFMLGTLGCAHSGAPAPNPPPAPECPFATAAPAVAPMPRALRDDRHRPARMEAHRNGNDPTLRDLARGHIQPGDDVEPLIRQNPQYDALRCGNYVVMS